MRKHPLFVLAVLCLALSPFAADGKAKRRPSQDEVLAKLQAVPGLVAAETTTDEDKESGYRRFALTLEQKMDHARADSPTFRQRLTLFHKAFAEPVVLYTSGYGMSYARQAGLTRLFGANQVQVEHRHFLESRPEGGAWETLNIRQSADDFHHVVEALKPLYPGRWVGTGTSKGGMTSIFHRRFYPNDLDGTVANSAPFNVSLTDPRYTDFLRAVGGEKYTACRQRLAELQREMLERRDELLPFFKGPFTKIPAGYALEFAALELDFDFWQGIPPEDEKFGCAHLPAKGAPAADFAAWLEQVDSPNNWNDQALNFFSPYYFQCTNELGYPNNPTAGFHDLLRFPLSLDPLIPTLPAPAFNPGAMQDVIRWAKEEGRGIMLVYGELDPWRAGALRGLSKERDNHSFVVPNGNHHESPLTLPAEDREAAYAVLSRWFGKSPGTAPLFQPAMFGSEEHDEPTRREIRLWLGKHQKRSRK